MTPELEAIVAADEEARARLEAARRSAEARVAAVRAEVARDRRERALARAAGLQENLAAIAAETDRQVDLRKSRRIEYLAGIKESARERLSEAAEAFERIVRDGPGGGAP